MSAFSAACGGVTTIFLVGLLGYLLARRGWVGPEMIKQLPRIITTVVIPAFLFRNITSSFERDQLLILLYGSLLPLCSISISFALAYFFARATRMRHGRQGTFRTGFSISSAAIIGLPVSAALFGEGALQYALLYFIANATFFWTLGNYSIARDGEKAEVRLFSLVTLKHIFSPPLLGFLAGMVIVLLGINIPSFLDKAVRYVGDISIGLSIMYVGMMLNGVDIKADNMERDVLMVFFGRAIFSPVCVLVLSYIFSIPPLMRNVFIIQAALPVMVQVPALAGYYKADSRYATVITTFSNIVCLGALPLWMVLITTLL